jgi:hypothetical protein
MEDDPSLIPCLYEPKIISLDRTLKTTHNCDIFLKYVTTYNSTLRIDLVYFRFSTGYNKIR